jgi:hypothetical protein
MRKRIWIPEIVVPERKIILPTQTMLFEGWFDIKLIHARTGRVKKHLRFRNLITNAALDALAANSPDTLTQFMGVGTGGTAPANTDTTLQTPIGTRINRSDLGFASGPSFAYWNWKLRGTFLEANANGTLTEIGLFSAAAGGTMWTRQLFKDGTGTPTAITKTASDQLQVTYEVRLYSPTVDATGIVVISGVNYNYTSRAADITNVTRWGNPIRFALFANISNAFAHETDVLGSTSGIPGGTATAHSSGSVAAYTAGTFYRDHTWVWDPGVANYATGIGSLQYGAPGASVVNPFQVSFSPKIPKDATKRLTLVGRLAWGRYP